MKKVKKIIALLILISFTSFGEVNYVKSDIKPKFDREYYTELILNDCQFEHVNDFLKLEDSIFQLMVRECDKYKIPYNMFFSIVDKESGFLSIPNKDGSGAFGYMQLMPKTFKNYYKKLHLKGGHTPSNNIKVGAYYIYEINKRWSHKFKNKKTVWTWTLAEYEAGLGGLQVKDSITGKVINYHIPEQCYIGIDKVMKNY